MCQSGSLPLLLTKGFSLPEKCTACTSLSLRCSFPKQLA